MSITFGSVCSGIEAASVAWLPLGWHCAFMSEIEAFPRAVLVHHYPETPLHGDFTTIQAGGYEPIDVLVGGTPCQSFSVAGLRGGLADQRGNLALEYLRLAERLRPRWVVWENVPGVRSADGGGALGAFLGGLGELGYGWAYRSLDAQYFGLAQRRERVFVVGHLGDWRCAAVVLFEPASLRWDTPPRRETRERVAASLTRGADSSGSGGYAGRRREGDEKLVAPTIPARTRSGGGLGTDFDCDGGLVARALRPTRLGSGGAERDGGDTLVAHSLRADGFDASEDGTGRGTPIVATGFQANAGGQNGEVYEGLSPAIKAQATGGGGMPAVAFQSSQSGIREHDTHATLDANNGPRRRNGVVAGGVRRLTPRECERLQGFPDDYTLISYRNKPAADGPRYRALGNSMAVPVMRWIGERIARVGA